MRASPLALALTLAALAPAGAAAQQAGGLSWDAPSGFLRQSDRPLRVATYLFPAAAGDAEAAELAVFYFGPDQGGALAQNLERWTAQFERPGKGGAPAAKVTRHKVAGLQVTRIDVRGTYLAAAGPMLPGKERKPGFRLLGAIAEGPGGSVFFKLTGPQKTVQAALEDFDLLVKSLR